MKDDKKKILVVDDDPDILDAVSLLLEGEGYEVSVSERGDGVEDLSDGDLPDLILLDLILSGRDGGDICRLLKSRSETRDVPVVMMSAHSEAEKAASEAGADGFLAKPFEIDRLLQTIQSQLSYS